MKRANKPSVGCVGAGKLARTLLPSLHDAGYPIVAVAAPRIASARSACREIPGAKPTADPAEAAGLGRLVLLAVPDREIAGLARRMARGLDWRDRTVLHHAGALGLDVLRPLARAGAHCGLFHPLQTLADPPVARTLLSGSRVRIEGSPTARRIGRSIAGDLGMIPLPVAACPTRADRSTYHAAASLVSNDLVALLAQAADLLESTGLSRSEAIQALVPLASGTLAQLAPGDLSRALSGPVVRGDAATVRAQLSALDRRSKRAARLHRLLSERLLLAAREAGHAIPEEALSELRDLLRSAGRPGGRTV